MAHAMGSQESPWTGLNPESHGLRCNNLLFLYLGLKMNNKQENKWLKDDRIIVLTRNLLRAVDGAAVSVVVKEQLLQLFMPIHQIVDDVELPSNSGILKITERNDKARDPIWRSVWRFITCCKSEKASCEKVPSKVERSKEIKHLDHPS